MSSLLCQFYSIYRNFLVILGGKLGLKDVLFVSCFTFLVPTSPVPFEKGLFYFVADGQAGSCACGGCHQAVTRQPWPLPLHSALGKWPIYFWKYFYWKFIFKFFLWIYPEHIPTNVDINSTEKFHELTSEYFAQPKSKSWGLYFVQCL